VAADPVVDDEGFYGEEKCLPVVLSLSAHYDLTHSGTENSSFRYRL
jgi:hypothetical protein